MRNSITMHALLAILLFAFINSSGSYAANNPFETNPKLFNYYRMYLQTAQLNEPTYLIVAPVDGKEREDVYQYLRGQIGDTLPIWQLMLLDYPQLRLLRNEIYAHHGYIFKSEDLDAYFKSFEWYKSDSAFSDSVLSQIERSNVDKITKLEFLKFNKRHLSHTKIKLIKKSTYVVAIGAEITNHFDGCCGVEYGKTIIKTKKGISFTSKFGSESLGNGYIRYLIPYWGKNLIAWISGEIKPDPQNKTEKLYDRLVVFDSYGSPHVDLSLKVGTLPMNDRLTVVAIEPDILLTTSDNDYQALVFMKKNITNSPKIGNLYIRKSFEHDSQNIDDQYANGNKDYVIPVNNPAVLWKQKVSRSSIKVVASKSQAIIFDPDSEFESYYKTHDAKDYVKATVEIKAIDKLTGKINWTRKVSALTTESFVYNNYLVVKYFRHLMLLDIISGKTIWDINLASDDFELTPPGINFLFMDDKYIVLANRNLLFQYYDRNTGQLLRTSNMKQLSDPWKPLLEGYRFYSWHYFDNSLFIVFWTKSELTANQKLRLITINTSGEPKWFFDSQVDLQNESQSFPDKSLLPLHVNFSYKGRAVCLNYSNGNIECLDVSSGKPILATKERPIDVVKTIWMKNDFDKLSRKYDQKLGRYYDVNQSPCLSSALKNGYIYAIANNENYGAISRSYIWAIDTCLDISDESNGWAYAPWDNSRVQFENIDAQIVFIDNNFMIVRSDNRKKDENLYWAIGDKALRDYVWRKDGNIYTNIINKDDEIH